MQLIKDYLLDVQEEIFRMRLIVYVVLDELVEIDVEKMVAHVEIDLEVVIDLIFVNYKGVIVIEP